MNMKELKDHIKKCKELYNQNKDWVEGEVFKNPCDEDMLNKFLNEYKILKGRHSSFKYTENLNVFFKLTFDSYVHGDQRKYEGAQTFWETRQECFDCFVGYLGSLSEAHRYFDSVNNVRAYT